MTMYWVQVEFFNQMFREVNFPTSRKPHPGVGDTEFQDQDKKRIWLWCWMGHDYWFTFFRMLPRLADFNPDAWTLLWFSLIQMFCQNRLRIIFLKISLWHHMSMWCEMWTLDHVNTAGKTRPVWALDTPSRYESQLNCSKFWLHESIFALDPPLSTPRNSGKIIDL